ncbi:MAG: LysR family transcriptional regulator [Bdellovibrionales bacterium]|nr:LysR family transcriptional regulator [Bdellovibrionales bacterium]
MLVKFLMWLNYHHLYYFFRIAEEESVSIAARKLHLSQPTLSSQLKQLEEHLQVKLFDRLGRKLLLTEDGRVVHRYARNIFGLGNELQAVLKGSSPSYELRLRIGVTVSLPKLVTFKTLMPVHQVSQEVKIECYEGKRETLLSKLGSHDLDLVLADAPFTAEVAVKAFNHRLGSSQICFYGTPSVLKNLKGRSPDAIRQAPFILPTSNTMIRRACDTWFEAQGFTPSVVAEFEDSALLKTYGSEGYGLFPAAAVVEKEIKSNYGVERALLLEGVKEEFFAISLERKVSHPAIVAITSGAKHSLR